MPLRRNQRVILIGRHDTEDEYVTGSGQLLARVHKRDAECDEGCVIHGASNHPMRDFPTHFRFPGQVMERICPHDVGHPDPDSIAFAARHYGIEYAEEKLVHGCDGCCSGAYTRLEAIKEKWYGIK